MRNRYRMVKVGSRSGIYYCEDTSTGLRKSLQTRNKVEAERLVHARNEAERQPQLNIRMGMAYLAGVDPKLATRTWGDVMHDIVQDKTGTNRERWDTAMKNPALQFLKPKVVLTTQASDFQQVLRAGTVSTNVYLRRLQNHCLDMGWLPIPILPKKKFPKIHHKERRGITADEHAKIIAREGNPERRDFYELCWYFGGSQSDIASLHAEDIDYYRRGFVYHRKKTGNMGGMRIGAQAWEIILRRPRTGPLFPYLITVDCKYRSTEFKQRCEGLGLHDITLHCYRYGWAERSADAGYPERYAQRVLGQNSKAVHRAYARKAQKQLPALEDYETAVRAAEESGKILILKSEAEIPKVA